MFWWIVAIIFSLGLIGGILWQAFGYCDMAGGILAAICGMFAIILLGVCIMEPISYKKAIYTFNEQKAYYESHVVDNEIEDTALTLIKIEQNEWLYGAQFTKQMYPFFCLIPDEVLELEPIE